MPTHLVVVAIVVVRDHAAGQLVAAEDATKLSRNLSSRGAGLPIADDAQ
jgi:hypothetical protein